MSSKIGVIGAACLTVWAVAISTSTASAQPPPLDPQVDRPLEAVHGDGARIRDDLDRTVILRGVNLSGLGEYYQEWDDLPAPVPVDEADFAGMATMGFNVVRLIVTWSLLEPEPGVIDTAYLDRIAQVVEWARTHDVYVLLDMHQDAWSAFVDTPDGVACPEPLQASVGWDGAPAWATPITGGLLTCSLGSREISVAVQTAFEHFYLDIGGVQGHLVDTWAALAGRFASDPAIAGYDLFNEPNPGLTIGVSDYGLLGLFYDRALDAIRQAEATSPDGFGHIGFFEPAVLTAFLPTPGPLPGFTDDDNLVYAPHLYAGSIGLDPTQTIEGGFAAAATAAANYGTAFFSGEWGWFGDPAADAENIERYAAQEDAHLVGGTWWQWEQACGDPHAIRTRGTRPACAGTSEFSDGLVTRPRTNTVILDRAYPRAAPGELRSIDADIDAGTLTITGTATRPATAADLWVPERCEHPAVSGDNVGATGQVSVPGGWRVSATVPDPGDYRIAVTCDAGDPAQPAADAPVTETAAATGNRPLPSTGGGHRVVLPLVLAVVAVVVRRPTTGRSAPRRYARQP